MNTLKFLHDRYGFDYTQKPPFKIHSDRENELTAIFAGLGFTKGVEVGVEQGVFAEQLCKSIPGLILYGVDPWTAYKGYREHVSQDKLEAFYMDTLNRMVPYEFVPVRLTSVAAADEYPDEYFDFVYIDGNHEFFYVADDLRAWIPKVRKGGIIAGHDYRRNSGKYTNDVKDVIPAYTFAKKINPWFVLTEPNKKSAPSWFWVK